MCIRDRYIVWRCRGDGRLTLRDLLTEGEHALQSAGIEDWKMDAWYLMEETLQDVYKRQDVPRIQHVVKVYEFARMI